MRPRRGPEAQRVDPPLEVREVRHALTISWLAAIDNRPPGLWMFTPLNDRA